MNDDRLTPSVSHRIRAARALAGMSLRDLAMQTAPEGLGERTLRKIETEGRAVSRMEERVIAEACQVPLWLLTEDLWAIGPSAPSELQSIQRDIGRLSDENAQLRAQLTQIIDAVAGLTTAAIEGLNEHEQQRLAAMIAEETATSFGAPEGAPGGQAASSSADAEDDPQAAAPARRAGTRRSGSGRRR